MDKSVDRWTDVGAWEPKERQIITQLVKQSVSPSVRQSDSESVGQLASQTERQTDERSLLT